MFRIINIFVFNCSEILCLCTIKGRQIILTPKNCKTHIENKMNHILLPFLFFWGQYSYRTKYNILLFIRNRISNSCLFQIFLVFTLIIFFCIKNVFWSFLCMIPATFFLFFFIPNNNKSKFNLPYIWPYCVEVVIIVLLHWISKCWRRLKSILSGCSKYVQIMLGNKQDNRVGL